MSVFTIESAVIDSGLRTSDSGLFTPVPNYVKCYHEEERITGIPKKLSYITVEEYLDGERGAAVKHEYVDGEIYAIAGESRRHNRIVSNFVLAFRDGLTETGCETYFEGVKVQANRSTFYYPDVLVTCEIEGEDDDYVIKFPCLIVEVLSPSTAATDKREKLIAYKLIDSLQEYAIVWQDELRVELHRRHRDGWLTFFHTQPEDAVLFTSIGLQTTVAGIYRGIPFEQ
ncbi:MAG: Uma2 family endonuclease [Acidobacteria bacterium]|nr:Uma2 family endonuclease [Acidobacteriota bacterium]